MRTASKWSHILREDIAKAQITTLREIQLEAMHHVLKMVEERRDMHNRQQEHTEAKAVHQVALKITEEIARKFKATKE